jgi:hypothetical protein
VVVSATTVRLYSFGRLPIIPYVCACRSFNNNTNLAGCIPKNARDIRLVYPRRYIYFDEYSQPDGRYISYKPLVMNQGPLIGTKVTGKCA